MKKNGIRVAWSKLAPVLSCWPRRTSVCVMLAFLPCIQDSMSLCWMGFSLILIYTQLQDESCLKPSYQVKAVLWFREHLKPSLTQNEDSVRIQGQRQRCPLNPETIVLAFLLLFLRHLGRVKQVLHISSKWKHLSHPMMDGPPSPDSQHYRFVCVNLHSRDQSSDASALDYK